MDYYNSYLKKKIEIARESMRNCDGRPNKEVEVEFAAKRNIPITQFQSREPVKLCNKIKK